MEKIAWWKDACIYQIYPLSFQDSNGDGIGDINGIISRLDYLKEFGVDVIWLSPIYESPMDDNGYDISNYEKIHPLFGTMEDFQRLLEEVHLRGMKLIMDLVINHTSDEHLWFQEARKGIDNPYRDYYIWREEPTDITSVFSGSAWEFDEKTKQYYFHLFSKKQPDLNWNNPALRQEIYRMINQWLDFGIDGFRLDVIDLIGKDVDQKKLADGPYLMERLEELYHTCFKGRDIMTVGETPGISIQRAAELTDEHQGFLNMVFQFTHIGLDEVLGKGKWELKPLEVKELKDTLFRTQTVFERQGWNSLFWANHDQPRAVTRYGNDQEFREKSAKMLFTVLYGLRGTPFVYQGEEFGMTGVQYELEEYRDIETLNMYRESRRLGKSHEAIMESIYAKGRDNSRTPMQWDGTLHAGFTDATPWLKVNDNYLTINAQEAIQNPDSVYHYARRLFALRRENAVFIHGSTTPILKDHPQVIAYSREEKNEKFIIIANFSQDSTEIDLSGYEKYIPILYNDNKKILLTKKTLLPSYYAGIYKEEK